MKNDVMAGFKSRFSPLKLGTRASMKHRLTSALCERCCAIVIFWLVVCGALCVVPEVISAGGIAKVDNVNVNV